MWHTVLGTKRVECLYGWWDDSNLLKFSLKIQVGIGTFGCLIICCGSRSRDVKKGWPAWGGLCLISILNVGADSQFVDVYWEIGIYWIM